MTSSVSGLDEDQARELLVTELAKPQYNQTEDPITRFINWLFEQLASLLNVIPGSSSLSTALIVAVLAIAIVATIFAVGIGRRDRNLSARGTGAVLEDETLNAADYRGRAAEAEERGDWEAVLLDSYRALTAASGERTLLDDAPTRTAHEVGVTLAGPFPGQAESLSTSADAFDRVRYGKRSCTRDDALAVRELDRTLQKTRPVPTWAHV